MNIPTGCQYRIQYRENGITKALIGPVEEILRIIERGVTVLWVTYRDSKISGWTIIDPSKIQAITAEIRETKESVR